MEPLSLHRATDAECRGGFGLVLLLYATSAISMAVLGMVVPFMGTIGARQHVTADAVGAGLAFFSLPAALLSFVFGISVDRIGVRRGFVLSIGLTVCGDLLLLAPSQPVFRLGLMLCGCGFAYTNSVAPALMVRALPAPMRPRALAFWSTFSPAGYSAGLLLAIAFLAGGHWHLVCLLHLLLMTGLLLGGLAMLSRLGPLPEPGRRGRGRWPLDRAVLTLGLVIALPNAVAYGTSLIAPGLLARTHGLSLSASALEVAVIKIAVMLASGAAVGGFVATPAAARRTFLLMAAVGFVAQSAFLAPRSGVLVASLGLLGWTFAYGAISGAGMSLLPLVIGARSDRGAVAGVVGQCISISSALVPALYFSTTRWSSDLLFAGIGLGVATLALGRLRPAPRPVHPG